MTFARRSAEPGLAATDGVRPAPVEEPYYLPSGDEVAVFAACHAQAGHGERRRGRVQPVPLGVVEPYKISENAHIQAPSFAAGCVQFDNPRDRTRGLP